MKVWRLDYFTDDEVENLDTNDVSVGSYSDYQDDEFLNLPRIDDKLKDKIFDKVVKIINDDEFSLTSNEIKNLNDLDIIGATVYVVYECENLDDIWSIDNRITKPDFKKVTPNIYIYQSGDPFDGNLIMINKELRDQLPSDRSSMALRYNGKGDLDLRTTGITLLPDDLKRINGDLLMNRTKITALPENLHIEGSLYADNSSLISLPENLHIEGSLYAEGTPISSLPENLYVGATINLEGTNIISLPKDLKKVNGDLNLKNTKITLLPEGLYVTKYLNLSHTPISSLPKNLHVGNLWLKDTNITSLPDDLKVDGQIGLLGDDGYTTWVDSIEEANKILQQQNSSKKQTRLSKVLGNLYKGYWT